MRRITLRSSSTSASAYSSQSSSLATKNVVRPRVAVRRLHDQVVAELGLAWPACAAPCTMSARPSTFGTLAHAGLVAEPGGHDLGVDPLRAARAAAARSRSPSSCASCSVSSSNMTNSTCPGPLRLDVVDDLLVAQQVGVDRLERLEVARTGVGGRERARRARRRSCRSSVMYRNRRPTRRCRAGCTASARRSRSAWCSCGSTGRRRTGCAGPCRASRVGGAPWLLAPCRGFPAVLARPCVARRVPPVAAARPASPRRSALRGRSVALATRSAARGGRGAARRPRAAAA